MPRRRVPLLLAALAACAGPAPAPPVGPRAAARPPNFVFFLADDQRADTFSHAGHPFVRTPHLDRLAREGVRFRNAYVTTSLCAPSRASFLTGLYSHAHGVTYNDKDVVDPAIPMFPQILQKAGYETVWIGKWHMPDAGRQRGFDHYFGFKGQGTYVNPKIAEGARDAIGPDAVREGYMDDLLTDRAVAFLKRPHDRPFVLLLWFKTVHGPWTPPERRRDLYRDVEIPEPPTFRIPLGDGRPPALALTDMKLERTEITKPWRDFVRRYHAMITGMDDNVGRVLAALDETGLAAHTMVVHGSDNGFFLGEYGIYDKRLMYEPSIRVPLLVRWPGRAPAGTVVDAPALNVDLAPTFLEAAGVLRPGSGQAPVPPAMHGRSLVPLLTGGVPADWRRRWYYEYDEFPVAHRVRPHRGVKVEERWKYIRWITDEGGEELYDVQTDPEERRNIAGDPAHAGLRERMRREFEAAKAEVGDTYDESLKKPPEADVR